MYKIEKNIEIPPYYHTVYPFEKMAVGDSFVIPKAERSSLSSAVTNYYKRHDDKVRFTIRKIDDETCRCWRIK